MLHAGLSKAGPGLSGAGGIKADGLCLAPEVIRIGGKNPCCAVMRPQPAAFLRAVS